MVTPPGCGSGGGEKWLDSEPVLQIEQPGFPNTLAWRVKEKERNQGWLQGYYLNHGEDGVATNSDEEAAGRAALGSVEQLGVQFWTEFEMSIRHVSEDGK